MRRRGSLVLALALLILSDTSSALNRDDAYTALFDMGELVEGGTAQPQWLNDGSRFWYAKGSDEARTILVVDTATGERDDFFDVKRLRAVLVATFGDTLPGSGVPFATFETSVADQHVTFRIGNRGFELDMDAYTVTEPDPVTTVPTVERQPSDSLEVPSPDGTRIAVIRDHGLYIERTDGTGSIRFTDSGTEILNWETYGAVWSADGAHLLTPLFDLQGVNEIPIVNWLKPSAPVIEEPYPLAQGPTYRGRLHLASVSDTSLTELDIVVQEFDIFVPLGLTPKGDAFLISRTNRTTTHQDLLVVDAATSACKVLITENRNTFLGGPSGLYRYNWYLTPVGDDEHFVWMSNREGQYHDLYLYDYEGRLIRRLTKDRFPIYRVMSIDAEGGWIYFLAKPDLDDPYSRQLCRVDLDGGKVQQLTHASGRHAISFDPPFTHFVDNHSDADRPPRAELRRSDGTLVRLLETADITRLEATGWTPPERVKAEAADGITKIWASIHRPPDFDPSLCYPVIEVIYAGPQWTIVPDMFVRAEYGETAAALARLGYVTVIIDGRGIDGRGRDIHDLVHRRLGQIEIPDHVSALRHLAETRPWLDLDRVGIHGKSWGGYFTLRAMLTAPDIYKVGVASGSIVDLATAVSSPVVPYMGLHEDNPEGYAAADCLALADKLEGNLLLTSGTSDRNTPFGHTMRALKAFNDADKDVEVLVLPGDDHWLRGSNFTRWQRALKDYFLEKMPPVALRK